MNRGVVQSNALYQQSHFLAAVQGHVFNDQGHHMFHLLWQGGDCWVLDGEGIDRRRRQFVVHFRMFEPGVGDGDRGTFDGHGVDGIQFMEVVVPHHAFLSVNWVGWWIGKG